MARILLIDDDPDVLRGLKRYLVSEGHEVRVASGGRAGLASLDADPVDVVITDINMPDVDGIEIVATLAMRKPRIPTIAISGGGLFGQRFLLDSARGVGAVVTLDKPFPLEALGEAVDRVLSE